MNIELSTGLEFFWQWDANLKLKVPDEIPEVHFRFGNKSKAYEVKDGWVSVPNELLQKPDDIECWFYDTEHTMDFGRIEGRRRPKPDGYVYEETEFKSWTELDEKITKALEELEKTNSEISSLGDKLDETNSTLEEVKGEIKDNTPVMIIYPTSMNTATAMPYAINKNYSEIKEHLDNKGLLFLCWNSRYYPCLQYGITNGNLKIDFSYIAYSDDWKTFHHYVYRMTLGQDGSFSFFSFPTEESKFFTLRTNSQKQGYEFVSSNYEDLYFAYCAHKPCLLIFVDQNTVIPISLRYKSNTMILSGFLNEKEQIVVEITSDEKITVHTNTFETTDNLVSEITDENSQTVTAYPNVAAVKSYVDERVQSVVSFDSEVVDELPETGVKGIVYFVPHTHL